MLSQDSFESWDFYATIDALLIDREMKCFELLRNN